MDATGILRDYHPVHITLTVPRDEEGNFQGERFFGDKLLYWFNIMRKYPFFKDSVFAGEAGLEVKKGANGKGYHIHIHSFSLLNKGVNMNKFRKQLQGVWQNLTGGSQIWVETLYKVDRHSNGKPVREYVCTTKGVHWPLTVDEYNQALKTDPTVKDRYKLQNRKIYVDPATSPIDDYIAGIMECIKYHFKPAMFLQSYVDADGKLKKQHDVAAILEVLTNTYRKRLYTRFGFFYGLKQLALNFKEEADSSQQVIDVNTLVDEAFFETKEGRAVTGADWIFAEDDEETARAEAEMKDEQTMAAGTLGCIVPDTDINPFTLGVGQAAGGVPVLYNVNERRHPKQKNYYKHFELSPYIDAEPGGFIFLKPDAPIPQLIKLICLGMADEKTRTDKGFVDVPLQTMQHNLVKMQAETRRHFSGQNTTLAEAAKAEAIAMIAKHAEIRIYSEDIVKVIREVRQKEERPRQVYWNASDKVNRQKEKADNLAGAPVEVQYMMRQTNEMRDVNSRLNTRGKLLMIQQQQVFYLRQIGFKIAIDDNGKIVTITPPVAGKKQAPTPTFFNNEEW